MSRVRTIAVALSVLFHGSLAYGLSYHSEAPRLEALDVMTSPSHSRTGFITPTMVVAP